MACEQGGLISRRIPVHCIWGLVLPYLGLGVFEVELGIGLGKVIHLKPFENPQEPQVMLLDAPVPAPPPDAQ